MHFLLLLCSFALTPLIAEHSPLSPEEEVYTCPCTHNHRSFYPVGQERGPVGSVCQDLADFYTDLAKSSFLPTEEGTQKQEIIDLMCSLLRFAGTLADQEYRTVRSEEMGSSIASIVKHFAPLLANMPRRNTGKSQLAKLIEQGKYSSPTDAEIELGIKVHGLLRVKDTAEAFLQELFEEISTVAGIKAHSLLEQFKDDTNILLDTPSQEEAGEEEQAAPLSQKDTPAKQEDTISPSGKRFYRSLTPFTTNEEESLHSRYRDQALFCLAASSACREISEVITTCPISFNHAGELLQLAQSLFAAMEKTYQHLSHKKRRIKPDDKKLLAHHFTHMVRLLNETEKSDAMQIAIKTRNACEHKRPIFIDAFLRRPTEQDQEVFMMQLFSNKEDRTAFFKELFPRFDFCMEQVLHQAGTALYSHTIDIYQTHYWGSADDFGA